MPTEIAKIDSISAKHINKVVEVSDAWINELEGVVKNLTFRLGVLLKEGQTTKAVDVAISRQQVEQILLDSGYYEIVGELLNTKYQDIMNEAYKGYKSLYGESFQFSDQSIQKLDAMRDLDLSGFNSLPQNAIDDITRIVINGQFGAIDFATSVSMLEETLGQFSRYATTYVNTATQAIYRASNFALADDAGFTQYKYVGPNDNVTREFCLRYVGQILSKEQINSLDNGQGLPVMDFGGGYNCRHQWEGFK